MFFIDKENAMKKLILISLSGLLTILLSSCGGGGDGTSTPVDDNALLSGEYQILKVEYEGDNFIAAQFAATADGQGNINAAGETIAYSIAADRTISISVPSLPTAEAEYGIVSSDGNLAVITDAQLIDPNNQNDVEMVLLVKKSTDMTQARMSGEYIISEAGKDAAGEYYTSRILVVLKDDGTGKWEILDHSIVGVGQKGDLFVSVAADGTFTMDSGEGPDTGIISPDANVLVITDSNPDDAANQVFFLVGVRKSTALPALSGTFQTHFIGYDITTPPPNGPQFAARWNATEDLANSEFDATLIIDSRSDLPPGATASISHTPVAIDGTFIVEGTDLGILSPDGRFFTIVETDTAEDLEIKLGFAIR